MRRLLSGSSALNGSSLSLNGNSYASLAVVSYNFLCYNFLNCYGLAVSGLSLVATARYQCYAEQNSKR